MLYVKSYDVWCYDVDDAKGDNCDVWGDDSKGKEEQQVSQGPSLLHHSNLWWRKQEWQQKPDKEKVTSVIEKVMVVLL